MLISLDLFDKTWFNVISGWNFYKKYFRPVLCKNSNNNNKVQKMKRKMWILTAIMIMMPVLAFSQARVTNGGNSKVEIVSVDGTKAAGIASGGTVFLSWLPQNGEAKYIMNRYDGSNKVSLGQLTGTVVEGNLNINDEIGQKQAVQANSRTSGKTALAAINET